MNQEREREGMSMRESGEGHIEGEGHDMRRLSPFFRLSFSLGEIFLISDKAP